MNFKIVFDKLGLSRDNGLFIISENRWKGFLPPKTEEIIENKLQPYAFFSFNDSPLILFFDNPVNLKTLFRQCWNFNQTPIIFIIENNQLKIYNGFSYIKNNKSLELLTSTDNLSHFEYFKIVTGETWEIYNRKFDIERRVDQKLLRNIEILRENLINKHQLKSEIANNLIGRIIFVRYLIDREVIVGFSDENSSKLTSQDFCNILTSKPETYKLFEYLQTKFNGNLFPTTKQERNQVNEQILEELQRLLQGDELKSGQLSLFDVYDFSIIPIELVSNIYEFFIGKEQQAKGGAYYTPLFLVNYILNDTVGKYFNENSNTYNCKVFDPACGSGVFLVETLRKIISQYQKLNPDFRKNLKDYQDNLKKLLTENIFGIDKDESAVNVAIFSLYITLLDYLESPEIVDFKFPPLLNHNFFISDFFDLDADYNERLNKNRLEFDFIIGNPPWGKIRDSEELYEKYWKDREKAETKQLQQEKQDKHLKVEIKISNKEIAQAFLIRVSDFSIKNTECALIVTSKVLYNINAKTFRQYFLSNFKIRKVFELSSVRREVFDKSNDPSVAPASILFYNYSTDRNANSNNIVDYISLKPNRFFKLFKIFVIEKYDQKNIPQKYFIDYDWIWKILVYGSLLDFNLIKRLGQFSKVIDVISDETKFIFGKGVCIKGGDKNPTDELAKIPYFVDTNKKDLRAFFINYRKSQIGDYKYIHRPRKIKLFKAPMLLIKKGIGNKLRAISAFSCKDCVFTDSLTSIKTFDKKHTDFLRALSGIFNSTFFSYFLLTTSSSLGIEREQAHDKDDKFQLPFPLKINEIDNSIIEMITQIEKSKREMVKIKQTETELSQEYININEELSQLLNNLEKKIFKIYNINKQEKALIDYSQEISIPLIKKQNDHPRLKELKYQSKELSGYATIFIKHFNQIYNFDGNYFETEILYSPYIIGMHFKVIPYKPKTDDQIVWINTEDSTQLLKKFSLVSFQTLSKDLFIQKDIKGFEENFFYIIKPNEYKCWHQAIAYLDLSEFIDALMESGAKQTFELQNA